MSHSCVLAPELKEQMAIGDGQKYGRLFPDLSPLPCDETALMGLGRSGAVMDAPLAPDTAGASSDSKTTPAMWPIFGQFVAHDITADRSLLQRHANLAQLRNFRTPALDIESVYGAGPGGTPYLFDVNDPDKFLLGTNDAGQPNDLPRNSQGVALVGDKRNDVHLLIAQLHVAFLKFHNAIVDHLRARGVGPDAVFTEAQRRVRWHYQWIVVHEYLPLTVGSDLIADILENGLRHYEVSLAPSIPVEFADAAYRFGHSQIRARYQLNAGVSDTIFPGCLGSCAVPQSRALDWRYFFAVDPDHPPQAAKRIDTRFVHPLIDLPEAIVGASDNPDFHSLAVRDLQRGRALDLPSGEDVARAMGVEPLSAEAVGLAEYGWECDTPLGYYILKEAEAASGGERLGPVGGRIVAEVLIGLIGSDPQSYLNADTPWTPDLPAATPGTFTMGDLLRVAGAVN